MTLPHTTAGLHLPNISHDDKLHRVLSSALHSRGGDREKLTFSSYWDAMHFNLNQVTIFQDATPEEQGEILLLCNTALLEEAYAIEKAGIGYMAKMVLLAESTEERMLYGLFAADEVTHLAQISHFLPTLPVSKNDPFLNLLAEVVESEDPTVLLFVLQVVLEGWGLNHYRSLARNCRHPDLSNVLTGFLVDESRHHATGVTLFARTNMDNSSTQTILHTLALFLQMVQAGPQSVVAAIEQVKGHLSKAQKVKILLQLDTQTHSGTRLAILRNLMRSPNAAFIVEELELRSAFQPLSADKCVF